MQEIDYKKLKFKSGLEIHQQLDSHKLFCNCQSVLRSDEPDYVVHRKLHAVAGESGEVDVAALYQASLKKEFEYWGYDTTCLIELDEEPPREINSDALKTAVQIALLFNCKIVPITQIMRKTVIDGSNTSGFQRTILIARDGFVETSEGKVGIEFIYLEEDAARIVSQSEEKDVYKLDRLGIPLVEIVTAPDLKNPEHAKETALKIGEILRNCKVRRGIGTIRQDVNVSIRNENRVEIKGMQDMNIFLKVLDNEILRQEKLSDEKKSTEMEVRNAQKDGTTKYMRPLPGASRMYPETDLPLLKISRDFINNAKKDLPKLKSEEKDELKKKGLGEEMVKILFKQNKIKEFKNLLGVYNNPVFVAKVLLVFVKDIARHKKITLKKAEKNLDIDVLSFVLNTLNEKKILESDVKHVLEKVVEDVDVEDAVKLEKIDVGAIEEKIMKIIKDKPGLSEKAYMGLVMKEFKGKVDGKVVMQIIKKYLL